MTEYSDAELLVYVNEAIKKRANGEVVQDYSAQGVRLRRDPLSDLYILRDRLKQQIESSTGPGFIKGNPI